MLPIKQLRGMRVGATEPPRVNGAMWLETNASGMPLQSWAWVWNVDRWLSPEQSWVANFDGTGGLNYYLGFPQKVRLKFLQADVFISGIHDTNNFLDFALFRIDKFGITQSQIASLKTTGRTPDEWNSIRLNLNQTIDTPFNSNAQRLQAFFSPFGNAGFLVGSVTLVYHFER